MKKSTLLISATFIPLVALFAMFDLDRAIARAWAFDAVRQRFIAEDSFWANELVHTGGRNLVLVVALAALLAALIGQFAPANFPRLAAQRRALWTGLLGAGLAVAVVGILKHTTNIACPWDLTGFGGSRPYVSLFGARHAQLPPAACFPGGAFVIGVSRCWPSSSPFVNQPRALPDSPCGVAWGWVRCLHSDRKRAALTFSRMTCGVSTSPG